jgi:hypothetical protein
VRVCPPAGDRLAAPAKQRLRLEREGRPGRCVRGSERLSAVSSARSACVSGSTKGSISITVKSANFDSKTLKGMTLTFATDRKTKVVLHVHKPIADGDRGIVNVRAAKGSDAPALQTHAASEVIDKGANR